VKSHFVDGFELKFTGRSSWKAEWRSRGRTLDVVPVTWTRGIRHDTLCKEMFLEVWYRNLEELENRIASPDAFVVALAEAKDYGTFPHAFRQFVAVFRVIPTGIVLTQNSIETKRLDRMTAKNMEDA